SPVRADRFGQIINKYGCPSARNPAVYWSGSQLSGETQDFQRVLNTQGFKQLSYLSPASFHQMPSQAVAQNQMYHGHVLRYSFTDPVRVRDNYRPRRDQIGNNPSKKIFVADGTRFYDPGPQTLDYDASPVSNGVYGS